MKPVSEFGGIQRVDNHLSKILAFIIIIMLAMGVVFIAKLADSGILRERLSLNGSTKYQQITVIGSPICLKDRKGKMLNGCDVGIKTDKGEIFAISGANKMEFYSKIGTGGIEISGEFIPAGTDEKADILGTIIEK